MKMPDVARWWAVDEVIECLSCPHPEEVQAALMKAMPDAYGDRPERETPPEPDADPQFKLAKVWHQLDGRIQTFIIVGFIKEGVL